ncbi:Anaphase-promoting complex subunit CDC27 [Bienertia sinuspersici]
MLSPEAAIQIAFLLLTLALFFVIYNLPKKAFSKLRSNTRATSQSSRHFLIGAQLLSRARATRHRAAADSLAKEAVAEADKALSLLPRDASALILRALALDILGRRSSALKSLDSALTPPAAKSLSKREKGDALVKRAELQLSVNRRRRVDSALMDLVEAVSLTRDNPKAFCLLGQCYEIKGMINEASQAFNEAIKVQPDCNVAREGLDRLKS